MSDHLIVGLVFIAIGATYALYPKKWFEFRAWIYKKVYDAKIEGSKRTYQIYKIMGIIFVVVGIFVLLFGNSKTDSISSFKECAASGRPVMESYPRRCSAGGKTFVEDISTR